MTPTLAVMRIVSPAKSTKVSRPASVEPGLEMTTANFCGWAAGPTGLMALITGRYVLPQPARKATAAVRTANREPELAANREADLAAERMDWKRLRPGRDCVFPAASILAKCKTAPAMVLVFTMLKA